MINQLGGTGIQVRQLNLALLRSALRECPEGATTRTLSRKTGLSLVTCGTLLAGLLETGEVIKLARAESSGGRPPLLYGCNPNFAMCALLYPEFSNGTRTLTAGVANAMGEFIVRESIYQGDIEPETVMKTFVQLSERFPRIRGAAIALTDDFAELYDHELPKLFAERFAFPIVLDHAMNFAVSGYVLEPETPQNGVVCMVHFPANQFPRAGIAINGMPLRGRSGFAGELSHLPFGISREQQKLRLANRAGLIGEIAEIIVSVTAVLNPDQVVLSGATVDESMREPLRKLCEKLVPPEKLPELCFHPDCREACFRGMAAAVMTTLAPPIQLVKRHRPVFSV